VFWVGRSRTSKLFALIMPYVLSLLRVKLHNISMDEQKSEPHIILRDSKKLPVVVAWGDKRIHVGGLELLKDGSLVVESTFHSDGAVGPSLEFGTSNFKDGKFHNHSADKVVPVQRGFHITLHPASTTNPAAMHFREHYPGAILFRREIDWFPVKTAFNLVRFFTMPLDSCTTSQKQVTVETAIDPKYTGSLEWTVDVFPVDVKTAKPYQNSIKIWGHCPNYRVRVSIMLAKQRTAALAYWPEDSELSL
jgi:hypothetical protein